MQNYQGATDCRVCAAMRERKGTFVGLGGITVLEGGIWLSLVYLLHKQFLEWPVTVALLATAALLHLLRYRVAHALSFWLDRRLTTPLVERVVHGKFRGQNYGPELSLDLRTLRTFLAGPTLILYNLLWPPMATAVAFYLNPRVGGVLSAALLAFLLLLILSERVSRNSRYEIDTRGMLERQLLGSAYKYAEDIEAMKMMPRVLDRFDGQHAEALAREGERERRFVHLRIIAIGVAVFSAATAATVLNDAPAAALTPAMLAVWSPIVLLAMIPPLHALTRWPEIGQFLETLQRLKAFAMTPPYKPAAVAQGLTCAGVKADRVQYGVAPGAPLILRDISFELSPGELMVVLGPSSAGKTTLARLLVGAIAPVGGALTIAGTNPFAANGDHSIGYLRQDVQLFDTDIAENISRLNHVDPDKVAEAAALAGVQDLILALPGQYRLQVGPDGERLSAGMRQRIALARALYGRPELVVLDEPNSSQDSDGELALVRAIMEMKRHQACVVLTTQRPGIVQYADKLLILEKGRMVSFGSRDWVLQELARRAA